MIRNSFLRRILLIITSALVGGYIVALALDWPSWIHGSNWVWVRRVPALWPQRGGWLVLLAGLTVLVWWWAGRSDVGQRYQRQVLLVWAVLMTPVAQWVFAALHSAQPWQVLVAMESGFYQEGVRLEDPVRLMQTHLAQMSSYRDVHVRTQPPGWMLAYWASSRVWGRWPELAEPVGLWLRRYDCLNYDLQGLTPAQVAAASLPLLVLMGSGLGALPFYGLGRRFLGERPSQLALVAYPWWPGMLVFTGRFDVLYAMLALLALWLAQVTVTGGGRGKGILFGVLLAVSTWFSFGVLSILLLVNCVLLAQIILRLVHGRTGWTRLIILNGWFVAAVGLLWGGAWLLWGVNGPAMFATSQTIHAILRLNYPAWFLFNLYDLAVFMGLVWFVGGLVAVGVGVWRGSWQMGDALVWGWVLAVLLLNVSGQVRAETGRLWLLLMGPGMLVGVWGWQTLFAGRRRGEMFVFWLFLLQAGSTAVFLGGRMVNPQSPPPQWHLPDTATTLDYQLGETIALRGYELRPEQDGWHVTLYWQALDFPRADYSVLLHLVTAEGQLLTQNDGSPHQNELPTWCWVPGEVVTDERVVTGVGEGERPYHLLVGLYDWRTGLRLPITPPLPDSVIPLPVE